MKFTNKFNLPEPIYKAILAHEHIGGLYTASGISKSIRSFILTRRHDDEIVKDISDMAWVFFGTMLHSYLEKYGLKGNVLSEQFLKTNIDGIDFTGTADLLCQENDKLVLVDYKTMSVWGWVFWKDGKQNDYEVQLNAYKYLYYKYDFYVKKLKIIAFFRNWEKKKVGENYPPTPIIEIPVKSWTISETEDFIRLKIKSFEKFKDTPENELPLCSKEELWQDDDTFAIKKNDNKKAVKICKTKEEAERIIVQLKSTDKKPVTYGIENRKGYVSRCEYCDAKPFCSQYVKLKVKGLIRNF